MIKPATSFVCAALMLVTGILAVPASAQTFPARATTIVVPFSPGGAADILGRTMAVSIEAGFGKPVLVENKPGADSRIGARAVASSPADGHSVVILGTSYVSWPLFIKEPGVDLMKDFAPIGMLVDGALVINAAAKTPYNSIREMIDYAKQNPGKIVWSSVSRSGEATLWLNLLRARYGVQMLEVPYKGSADQQKAIMSGDVDIAQFAPARFQGMEQAGQVKGLAISGAKRDPRVPKVPTMKELGFDGFDNYSFGLFAPAGTPGQVIDRWHGAVVAALKDPKVEEQLVKFGFNAVGSTPASYAAELKKAYDNWKLAASAAGIQPE